MTRLRRPPGYPRQLECDLTLADGRRVHVRPVVPDDAAALRAAVEQADAATLRGRFLGGRPPRDEESIRRLVELDYVTRLAVAAFSDGTGVAIARYEGSAGSDVAEIAVAVDNGWRHVGLATGLIRLLARAALARGIHKFTATYFATNVDVRDLVTDSGLPHLPIANGSVVEDVIALTPDGSVGADDREDGLRGGNGNGAGKVPSPRDGTATPTP